MKKLVSILVVMFSLVVFSSQAFAGGKADIPYWWYYYSSSTNYVITMFTVANRSEKDVDVTLSLRGEDGNAVTQNIAKVGPSGNYQSAANVQGTIPAYGERVIYLNGVTQTPTIRGGGTISWEFNDEAEGDTCRPLSVVIEKQYFKFYSGSSSYVKSSAMFQLMVNGDTWF